MQVCFLFHFMSPILDNSCFPEKNCQIGLVLMNQARDEFAIVLCKPLILGYAAVINTGFDHKMRRPYPKIMNFQSTRYVSAIQEKRISKVNTLMMFGNVLVRSSKARCTCDTGSIAGQSVNVQTSNASCNGNSKTEKSRIQLASTSP